ncbi:MAG: hypothetical protein JWN02_2580 [Acidobacteria bacterium]|nr:hypothetical protein [Acidobacteriota bacterium]
MKKLTLLLVITLLALSAAPSAMACQRCKPRGWSCIPSTTGYQVCEEVIDGCNFSGACTGAVAAETPLATDFTIASVERLDQPNAGVQLSQLDNSQAPQQTASLAR